MNLIERVEQSLGLSCCNDLKPIRLVSQKLNVRAEHITFVLLSILSVFLLFTCVGQCTLMTVFTFLIPFYYSIRYLNNPLTSPEGEARKWLVYWICFGMCFAGRPLVNKLLFFFPFKNLILTALLSSIYFAPTQKFEVIHSRVLKPIYAIYEKHIGSILELASSDVSGIGQTGKKQK